MKDPKSADDLEIRERATHVKNWPGRLRRASSWRTLCDASHALVGTRDGPPHLPLAPARTAQLAVLPNLRRPYDRRRRRHPDAACAERAEPPPLWPQLPLSPLYLLQHFAYGRGSHEYTIFTSLLLHRDAHHRDNNAISLALAGFGPFLVWGWPGFWALILGGNAAACLTFQDGRKVQLQSSIERHTGGLLKQGGNITSGLSRALALLPAQACGASAGVFALMGADLCLLADRVAALLVHLQVPAHDRAMPTAQLAFELRRARLGLGAAHLAGRPARALCAGGRAVAVDRPLGAPRRLRLRRRALRDMARRHERRWVAAAAGASEESLRRRGRAAAR